MTTFPLKGLGRSGIVRDVAPYNLPLTAWSNGNNVRFENGRVRRAPSFRTISDGSDFSADPAFAFGVRPSSGSDYIVYTLDDGSMYTYRSGHVDRTPSGFSTTTSSEIFTGTVLDDCAYVNRSTDVPYVLTRAGSEFEPLSDYGWSSNDRAGIIRAFRDYLIFLNVQIGATVYPTGVRWSDTVDGDGDPPSSFDLASTTNNAGLNPLPDMSGEILDGLPLKDRFLIYSNSEVWRMRPTTDTSVFTFDKLFDDEGILATNCVVQVDGLHYVFGEHDIYVTDGLSKRSILENESGDSTNREFIFSSMVKERKANFKVMYDRVLDEVLFFYVSSDGDATYPGTTYPNRIAAYNTVNKTWSFRDAPSIVGGATLILTDATAWDDTATTWDGAGGTWDGGGDSLRTALYVIKREDTAVAALPLGSAIYAYDQLGEGSTVPAPLDAAVTPAAFVEKERIDLDEVFGDTWSYKEVRRLYPQARAFGGAVLDFEVGGSLYPWSEVTYTDRLSFDPMTATKVDFRKGGRYLAIRFTVDEPNDFWFSGADIDVVQKGRRG